MSKKPSLKDQGYPSWSFGQFWHHARSLVKFSGRLPAWGVDHYYREAQFHKKGMQKLLEEWPLMGTVYAEQHRIDMDHIMDVEARYADLQTDQEDGPRRPT